MSTTQISMPGDVPKSRFSMSIDFLAKVRDGAITDSFLEQIVKGQVMPVMTQDILGEWHEMYWKIFKIDPRLDRIVMPEAQPGFGWAIPRVPEIPTNLLWEACKERWLTTSYIGDDLEVGVPTNERHYSQGPYGIWVRDRQEADEELKNLSAEDIAEKKIATITLDERLALGLFYVTRVSLGLHLDVKNITLCSGSRGSGGRVPSVDWGQGVCKLYVNWYDPQDRGPRLRSRAVVSLPAAA